MDVYKTEYISICEKCHSKFLKQDKIVWNFHESELNDWEKKGKIHFKLPVDGLESLSEGLKWPTMTTRNYKIAFECKL